MKKKTLVELQRISATEFKATQKIPVVLILDNIRSALNVGSAFRTADAFLVEKIWLCGITATPPHREILKTALGATETVDWEFAKQTADAIRQVKEKNYRIFAVEQAHNSIILDELEVTKNEKYCFIFGNEVGGVSDEVVELSEACVEIPQFGTKHSLNIAVCVGIIVWHTNQLFSKIM